MFNNKKTFLFILIISTSVTLSGTTRADAQYTKTPVASVGKAPKWSKCPMWYDEAIKVGWKKSEWKTLDRVIYRESRCNKMSYNPTDPMTGSRGLTQINGFWCSPWSQDSIGFLQRHRIVKKCRDLFNPVTNLKAARAIYEYGVKENGHGWGPWNL